MVALCPAGLCFADLLLLSQLGFPGMQSQKENNGIRKNDPSHPRACCDDGEAARANFNRPGPSSNKSNIASKRDNVVFIALMQPLMKKASP